MSRNIGALALRPLVEELQADPELGPQIIHAAALDGSAEEWGELDPPLAPPLRAALAQSGVGRLWSHQTAALSAARRGENVLITTPTASGKSLVYQLPVLEEAIRGGPGHALFLFPLKALAQDQAAKFEPLATLAGLG